MTMDSFTSTLLINLGCQVGERLAIISDDGPFLQPTAELPTRAALAERFCQTAERLGLNANVFSYANLGRSGIEPPAEIFAAVYPTGFCEYAEKRGLLRPLLNKNISDSGIRALREALSEMPARFDVLLVLSRYSISHTRFRTLLSDSGKVRAATMPGVEPFMFSGAMTADWGSVKRRSDAVAKLLSAAERAEIESTKGYLTFSLAGRAAASDSGLLTEAGAFGNLPGGEAFIAPVEGSAEGTVSLGPPDRPDAWWFRFAAGQMVEIGGQPPFQERLEKVIAEHPLARNLAELGVGTNEKASNPDVILEAEKILGTVHLALGDNAGFGGTVSVPFHQDYVVYKPTLRLIDATGRSTVVLENGKFLLD